jgi:PAT family beta-lactamase induction signal transducer AmpG
MNEAKTFYRSPWLWVPTSYMAMGAVLNALTITSNFAFKNLEVSNALITALAGVLTIPYTIKFLWAPLLELYRTKKFWIILVQFGAGIMFILAGFALRLPSWLAWTFGVMMLCSMLGATQDVGSDGVYVTTLKPKQQAQFAGVQSMAWSIGPILATGVLVRASGMLHDRAGYDWTTTWLLVWSGTGLLMIVLALYHTKFLPTGGKSADTPKNFAEAMKGFGHAYRTFFQKKMIWRMLAVAFFYRFGIYLLEKVGNVFLIDGRDVGGLGLTNEQAGDVVGIYGFVAFIIGTALGGLLVAKTGLNRKMLLILCLCINIPNLTFVWLSQSLPQSYALIAFIVSVEKFGYGFGAVAHMLYMMQQIAPGPYKTAHYAFATGAMGLCNVTMALISGTLQTLVGYQWFFILVLIFAIPSLLAVWFAPFLHDTGSGDSGKDDKDEDHGAPAEAAA